MPYPNFIRGRKRFWTQERVIAALQKASEAISGPLPCCDGSYNMLKKGNLDWPTSRRILEYFGSMANGWLVAGCPKSRISRNNLDWTPEEREYLLNNAGAKTLKAIAGYLRRSYGSVRKQLHVNDTRARDAEGYISSIQLSRELPCSNGRLRRFLNEGRIKGAVFDKVRNRWKIDPFSISPEMEAVLKAPRMTHNTWPLDVGDYRARYGIVRSCRQELAGAMK